MSKLLRYHRKWDICFVASVTNNRNRILVNNADLMLDALKHQAKKMPFGLLAYVIMPDHFHALIDCRDQDLSEILRRIKLSFSKQYRLRKGMGKGRVWQERFWDHIIRDQTDMNRHIDYIHYNPVKHGLVMSPFDWAHSSIHEFRVRGYYGRDWGKREILFPGDFGE